MLMRKVYRYSRPENNILHMQILNERIIFIDNVYIEPLS